jgi:hypothetical protein
MTTLRDALSEALGSADSVTLNTPTETTIETAPPVEVDAGSETAEQREARQRDERGRFAPKQEPENKLPAPVPQEGQQAAPATRKPPSSWKKDYWGQWERLGADPELSKLQEYIEQRESDYAKGVSTYKSQWDQAAPIYEAIQPFVPELQQHGIQPQQWIQNLGNAHRTLALGSPEQKLQMFAKLATEYGIPLQALAGGQGQADPQVGHIVQNFQTLQQKVNELEHQRKQEADALMQREIQAFQKDAPHFEVVKGTMAQLLQSGVAPDLKTAYDKAIRLHDDIWQQHQATQAKSADAARQAEIAKKKAAAVSPRSSSPTGTAAAAGGKKSLRDSLSEQFDEASTGRF